MVGGEGLVVATLLTLTLGEVVVLTNYTHYEAMVEELEGLAASHPSIASTYSLGSSVEVGGLRVEETKEVDPPPGPGVGGPPAGGGRWGEAPPQVCAPSMEGIDRPPIHLYLEPSNKSTESPEKYTELRHLTAQADGEVRGQPGRLVHPRQGDGRWQ